MVNIYGKYDNWKIAEKKNFFLFFQNRFKTLYFVYYWGFRAGLSNSNFWRATNGGSGKKCQKFDIKNNKQYDLIGDFSTKNNLGWWILHACEKLIFLNLIFSKKWSWTISTILTVTKKISKKEQITNSTTRFSKTSYWWSEAVFEI